MKTMTPVIAAGLSILFGSATASAGEMSPTDNGRVAALTADEVSSRHRCVCRSQRHHRRKVRTITRYHRSIRLHSSYPHAPWHSFDYFPRYRLDYSRPIVIVYRG